MAYTFGQDIPYYFYPLVDDSTPGTVYTTASLAVYLFEDQPARSQAAAGTDALATITSSSWDQGRKAFSFTIPAVDDPEPTSAAGTETYWLGVNLQLQAGEQVQTVLLALELERVRGQGETVDVTPEDLRKVFRHIDTVASTPTQAEFIGTAIDRVKSTLRKKKIQWHQVTNPKELRDAVIYRALYMLLLGEIQSGNDRFAIKFNEFKGEYETIMDGLPLTIDSDGDGKADAEVEAAPSVLWVIR